MRRDWVSMVAISAAGVLGGVATAQTPVSAGFTYQGRLDEAGGPANGVYDFTFRLYDAAAAGVQVGATLSLNDQPVTDGLFATSLNFGSAAFAGSARWLEIAVRPGASAGAYTPLAARQPLTVAPYALFALGSGQWQSVGTAVTNSNTGFVGVNRSAPVSGAEVFGLRSAGGAGSYGGMYIATDSETAKPFYGYYTGLAGGGVNSAWTYLDGASSDWRIYNGGDRLTVKDNGNVGVGTTTPTALLESAATSGVALRATNAGTGWCAQFLVSDPADTANGLYSATYGGGYAGSFEAHNNNATPALSAYKNGGPALRATSTLSAAGTPATDCVVAVVGGTDTEPGGGGYLVLGSVTGSNVSIDNNEIMARDDGAPATLFLNADGGNVDISGAPLTRVKVLEVMGADLAERFPVSDAERPAPGMVVMIDAANPGKLCLARGAYNRCVAGVVSGANGLSAGSIMGNLPGHEDAPAIALSGRVWVQCDSSEQAIAVGDLLTTSDTPGHAMTAADGARAHGAVIGKAMTGLGQGERGMVLVLVNLQ